MVVPVISIEKVVNFDNISIEIVDLNEIDVGKTVKVKEGDSLRILVYEDDPNLKN